VVDPVASGHIVSQLAAPQAINRLVQVGLIRQQTGWMLEILSDPRTSGALVVATPEEMPVTETIELIDRLRTETTVNLAGVIVNRVLPELFGTREGQTFEAICGEPVREFLASKLGGRPEPLLDAARLMVKMRRSRAAHLERLRGSVGVSAPSGTSAPLLYVPYLFLRSYGLRSTRQVAAALAAELES
jgi:anion-transporting  ArsA/GET3 family ATPase